VWVLSESIAAKVAEQVLKKGVKLDLDTKLDIKLWGGRAAVVYITGKVIVKSPPDEGIP